MTSAYELATGHTRMIDGKRQRKVHPDVKLLEKVSLLIEN